MANTKLKVGISQGDANGISYEVIIKALNDDRVFDSCTPIVYGSSKIFGFYKSQLHDIDAVNTNNINDPSEAHPKRVNIINCLGENVTAEPGISTIESAKASLMALERAVADLKAGKIDVLVTAPFNKHAMEQSGFPYSGHTDYLQAKFGVSEALMVMVSSVLKIGVVTDHIPVSRVAKALTKEGIVSKLNILNQTLKQDFKISSPRIAVLGLNPHCGDGGLMGKEEQEVIIPAVREAISKGIHAYGPYSPDGFFGLGSYHKFDAVLAMYHDQGLIPFKVLAFDEGVNYTAGLPVIRTSPDHGTAYDMAGRDEASPYSMRSAIYAAVDIYKNRQAYHELVAGKMIEPEEKPWEPKDRHRPAFE